ncbi:MAG: hypothetical protein CMP10_07665 [Zetaproteobacteria bacterium]|nr:hypothetical protein [Pseudobdellovibrionaceae bacterium]|tara:strand:- start:622 stop:1389 length:768 start_codon:yes stop_codon:yes gene_type:complete
MTTVLIADSCKPSLVMTSEIFKDKIPGTIVLVAGNGQEVLDHLENSNPDLCVVDFDLPDVDGVSLVDAMRKQYSGPILMTAFPDKVVEKAVKDNLFAYNDAYSWISKPIKFDELAEKIELFMINKERINRRFDSDVNTLLIGKASGRGKRAPKVKGRVINISIGGACVKVDGAMKMKKEQELTVSLPLPNPKVADSEKKAEKPKTPSKTATLETKVKATVAWICEGEVGVEFSKMTDLQRKGLVSFLRSFSDSEI